MALQARQAGMEQADVDPAGHGIGIAGDEVLGDRGLAKLWPWIATPRSSRRTVSGRASASTRTFPGRRRARVILLAASWLPAMMKTGIWRRAGGRARGRGRGPVL